MADVIATLNRKPPAACVVGAGPAGCVAAAALAKRGYKVDVFERRPETTQQAVAYSLRNYPMIICNRGVAAVKEAGLDIPLLSPESPAPQAYQAGKETPMSSCFNKYRQFLVDRGSFAFQLMQAAREQHSKKGKIAGTDAGSITWHWGTKLTAVDWDQRTALFEQVGDSREGQVVVSSPAGATAPAGAAAPQQQQQPQVAVQYDLLIGADGASSRVRAALQQAVPSLKVEQLLDVPATYKTFHGIDIQKVLDTPAAHLFPGLNAGAWHFLYFFRAPKLPGPPNSAFWPQRNGTLSGMIANTKTYQDEEIRAFLQHAIPGISTDIVDSIVEQVKEGGDQTAQPSAVGRILRLSQFHGPRCVLLGDAAHPITAAMGQGCNSALDSTRCFVHTLDAVGGDLDQLPAAFTAARIKDAHAMQQLEFFFQIFGRPHAVQANWLYKLWARAVFTTNLLLFSLGHKYLPFLFPAPFFLHQVWDAEIPYSKVLRAMFVRAGLMALVPAVAVMAAVAGFNNLPIRV